jgi:hypothetical protein
MGAHFPDVAVSASSTALTIRTSTDGEDGSQARMGFSRRSSLMGWAGVTTRAQKGTQR